MAANPFIWTAWEDGELPALKSHSKIKLEVLRQYVESYIEILVGHRYGATEVELTFVDGFCGGGIYANNIPGSPLVLLQAVRTAEAKLNETRSKPIRINGAFYFVDNDLNALKCLRYQIENSEFKAGLDRSIHLIHGCFSEMHQGIVQKSASAKGKNPHTIFFLDQCGYSKVDMRVVAKISKAMNHKAEFIINFAISWMADFIKDDAQFRTIFAGMGVSDLLDLEKLVRIREEKPVDWHYIIESEIGPAIWKASGCPYYSPFYIRPDDTSRGYWLLHLAQRPRARTAMADVLWDNTSGAVHYGGCGLRMLEYRPQNDSSLYLAGFSLSDVNRTKCIEDLGHDIGELIHNQKISKISLEELSHQICNDTVANPAILKESLLLLKDSGEISISGPADGAKRSENLSDKDIIKIEGQKVFAFFPQKRF